MKWPFFGGRGVGWALTPPNVAETTFSSLAAFLGTTPTF